MNRHQTSAATLIMVPIVMLAVVTPCLAWWCAPTGGCAITREKCEEKQKESRCDEYPDSFWYQAKFRDGQLDFDNDYSALYPNRAQCEAKRKEAATHTSLYRSVDTRCRSKVDEQTRKWDRTERYARSIPSCRGITTSRAQALDQILIESMLDHLAKKEDPVEKSTAEYKKTLDDGGYWDVVWAQLLAEPPEEGDWTEPYRHGGTWAEFYVRGGAERLQREKGHLANMVIVDETLTPKDFSDLKWAAANPKHPRATAIVGAAVENVKAVETTMGYHDAGDPLVWVAGHLADPRSGCIVDLLARTSAKHKKELANLEAFARKMDKLRQMPGRRSPR